MSHTASLPVPHVLEGQIADISASDMEALRNAVLTLERADLITKISGMAGKQMAFAGRFIPDRFASIVQSASRLALRAALHTALLSLGKTQTLGEVSEYERKKSRRFHKNLAALTGAAGGALGLAGLSFELPVSTILILRSIAKIAHAEGEDPHDPETALACLEVFALSSSRIQQDGNESSYFAVRTMLARSVGEAASFLMSAKVVDESAPVLLRLIGHISNRFGIVVSQKIAAQAVPIMGAASAATLNYAFVDHFQKLAHAHFTVRRLERIYGQLIVREAYESMSQNSGTQK